MAKQDEFVRITLRLPPELYASLKEVAAVKSINAAIVDRLESSFKPAPASTEVLLKAYQEGLKEERDKATRINKETSEVLARLKQFETVLRRLTEGKA